MLAKERQDIIYEMIQSKGAVTTNALLEHFQVSLETIRRDLQQMERSGLLTRVHGGAVASGGMKSFRRLTERNLENNDEKRKLACKAAEFVQEGDIIGLDSGSTSIYLAEVLKERFSRLTVVTHSTDVFEVLRSHREFSVILCGGYYLKEENAFCGPLTLKMLEMLHVQKVFIAVTALSLEFGICDYHRELYAVQQKLMQCADSVFFIADSSKFEKRALLKLDDMRREYCYITDDQLSEELRRLYAENDIRLYIGQ